MPRVHAVRMIAVLSILTVAVDVGVGASALPDPPPRAGGPWSAPLVAGDGAVDGPRVTFASSGDGAITWSVAGGGTRELALSAPGRSAGTGASHAARPLPALGPRALPLRSVDAATADGSGRVVLAGGLATLPAGETAALEASPEGPFGAPRPLNRGGGPIALASYLTGTVAFATAVPYGAVDGVVLRMQGAGAAALGAPVALSALRGTVTAIAVGLDWRGDSLVAWQQDGRIYARERRTSGTLGPLQTVGVSASGPRLGALISDDGRGIVAWTDETAPTRGEPRVARTRLSISAANVRFTRPSLVEAWPEPPGLALGPGTMRLIRLANGRVVLGWTSSREGELVVRVAPVTLAGLHAAVTVSQAGTDAQLADLAPGRRGEVLALFTATGPGVALDGTGEIEAAVGVDVGTGQAQFSPAEPVAAGAADGDPVASFEPTGDRPAIAWRVAGAGGQVRYAVRATESLPP